MSSTATAPEGAGSGADPRPAPAHLRRLGVGSHTSPGLILAAALVALAFTTSGGFDTVVTGGDTWSEIALIVLGAGAGAVAVLLGARCRGWGGATVTLFAAVAVLTAASIAWSVQPEHSWQAAGQTFAYLAAFAGAAALARIVPGRWPVLVGALATAAVALSLCALVVKIFPGTFAANDTLGRLQNPFGYWNAIGVCAALGLPPCLWAGSAPERARVWRVLTVPAISVLIAVVVLSFSRSALLAAGLGAGLWIAVVPLRLRAAAVLAAGATGGAVISGWALAHSALTADGVALPERSSAGHTFGVVIVVALLVISAAGLALAVAQERLRPAPAVRRRIGIALLIGLALIPAGGVVALAASSRGFTGEISHVWDRLTSTNGGLGVGDNAGRIGQLGNSRPLYWSQGITVGEHALLTGVGAEGFATARTRYTSSALTVDHTHSYVIEAFADLGLTGVAVNLALLLAWGVAAARPLGLRRRWDALTPPLRSERAGLIALGAVSVAFGAQSAVDWTWFFTGVAVPPLLCAGWLAGRGPLEQPVGRAADRPSLTRRPGAVALVAGLAAVALLAAWMTWQPLRSAQAVSAALNADTRGDTATAFTDAREAARIEPVAIEPLQILSSLYLGAGDRDRARAALVQATVRQPDNYNTWLSLGQFDLGRGRLALALASLVRAHRLDLTSLAATDTLAQARAKLAAIAARR